jgi:MATE family multidrug resistance protein
MDDRGSSGYQASQQGIGAVLDNSLLLSLTFGAATIVLAGYPREILGLLLGQSDLIRLADAYIRIIKWVMPLAAVFFSFYGLLAAVQLTRIIMVATVGVNVLNVGLNYILIFGRFGIPALGIEGAAIGTVSAQSLGAVFLLAYVVFSNRLKGYRCCRGLNLIYFLTLRLV